MLVSTDKAVNPGYVLGATKRLAEERVRPTAPRTWRSYVSVRFGNVPGSRRIGSLARGLDFDVRRGQSSGDGNSFRPRGDASESVRGRYDALDSGNTDP